MRSQLHLPLDVKGFLIWIERVSAAVKNSEGAHFVSKRAGRPRGNSELLMKKKDARTLMRQALRMTLYQQKQDLPLEIMNAKVCGVKLFHRLIRRQRTIPNTATQILIYNGETLTGAKDIASGFASNFLNHTSSQRLVNPYNHNVLFMGHRQTE